MHRHIAEGEPDRREIALKIATHARDVAAPEAGQVFNEADSPSLEALVLVYGIAYGLGRINAAFTAAEAGDHHAIEKLERAALSVWDMSARLVDALIPAAPREPPASYLLSLESLRNGGSPELVTAVDRIKDRIEQKGWRRYLDEDFAPLWRQVRKDSSATRSRRAVAVPRCGTRARGSRSQRRGHVRRQASRAGPDDASGEPEPPSPARSRGRGRTRSARRPFCPGQWSA